MLTGNKDQDKEELLRLADNEEKARSAAYAGDNFKLAAMCAAAAERYRKMARELKG